MEDLESAYVKVFACPVTFERAYTMENTLPMIIKTIEECGYPNVLQKIKEKADELAIAFDDEEELEILNGIRKRVLKSAKRSGKARFSQIASKHVEPGEIPPYIKDAVNWLLT